jgi:hypothetical protein
MEEHAMWRTVRLMGFSVFAVFWVTLALFPGITSEINSTNPKVCTQFHFH